MNVLLNVTFCLVPSDLITSVTLTLSPTTQVVGENVGVYCTAELSVSVFGGVIEFDYEFMNSSVSASNGTTHTSVAAISPVTVSSAGEYACTVTVTAPGVCGGGGSEPACPTKTSNPVTLTVRCEFLGVCVLS